MDNARIKEILLDIAPSELEFTVTQTGKESKRVNGFYMPDTHEIFLHNKNFKNENQLIYTAVHEYTHHLTAEELLKTTGNSNTTYNAKVHSQAFWAKFNQLLMVAEEKGYYKLEWESNAELKELTEKIKKEYLETNGRLMQEFGKLLMKAHELCEQADIRYEDYIDRVLCLPRNTAKEITKVGAVEVNPAIGFENMKIVASVRKKDDRADVEQEFLEGKGPVTVRELMRQKAMGCKPAAENDQKAKLEKEKSRLEKTIDQLSKRLEFVEESLANM